MSMAVESTVTMTPLPLPVHFALAESFSLKRRRRLPFSSSSTSASPHSSPVQLSHTLPRCPSPPCPPLSRVRPTPWKPISSSLSRSPLQTSLYDPSKHQTYFDQCFTNLGLLGRGSFGEVYKVLSHEDGRHYAVKRSVHQFRGNGDRNRSVKEARNHERLCPHPHILGFVAAWEEGSRLYIQMELCCTTLLLHVEDQPPTPDETAAWSYLCDLLSALNHLHSQGFVHLDIKPANVFLTRSGRLKLGDFGLLLELPQRGAVSLGGKGKEEDLQEGDPRYMALELLRGEYGPAADVFSLGITILELACNMEIPTGGDGWQKLRQGYLPSEFTNGNMTVTGYIVCDCGTEPQTVQHLLICPLLEQPCTASDLAELEYFNNKFHRVDADPRECSAWHRLSRRDLHIFVHKGHMDRELQRSPYMVLSTELQTVLKRMLAPEPSERATVADLLSLPSVRRNRWRRHFSLLLHEAMLTLVSLYQSVVSVGWRLLSSLHFPLLHWTAPAPCTPPKDSWERNVTLALSILNTDPGSLDDDAEDVLILDPIDPMDPDDSPTFAYSRIKSRLSFGSTSTPLLPGSPMMYNQFSPAHTPTGSSHGHSPSCSLAHTPSSIHSTHNLSDHSSHSRHCACSSGSQRRARYRDQSEEVFSRYSVEPKKNLLGLFEESALEGQL